MMGYYNKPELTADVMKEIGNLEVMVMNGIDDILFSHSINLTDKIISAFFFNG